MIRERLNAAVRDGKGAAVAPQRLLLSHLLGSSNAIISIIFLNVIVSQS